MKKFGFSLLSLLLVLPMMIGSFAACSNKDEEKEIKYNQACTLIDEEIFHGRDISMEWHTGLSALGSGV